MRGNGSQSNNLNLSLILTERNQRNRMEKSISQEAAKQKIGPPMAELIKSDIKSKIIRIFRKLNIFSITKGCVVII